MQQISYGDEEEPIVEAINEPHLACLLLLDSSGSMKGSIENLNAAVARFRDEVCENPISRKRVDIAIVEFNNDAYVLQDFSPIVEMKNVYLKAVGMTSMGKAIDIGLDMLEERRHLYKTFGTPYFKPWVFLITDGEPTDTSMMDSAISRVRSLTELKKVRFYAVGVDGYNKNTLFSLTDRVIELRQANFTNIFNWLSKSMVVMSESSPTEEAKLPFLPYDARKASPDRDVSDWD